MMWQSFLEKAVWFLKLYVREYRYLVAVFGLFCIFLYFVYALDEYSVFSGPA